MTIRFNAGYGPFTNGSTQTLSDMDEANLVRIGVASLVDTGITPAVFNSTGTAFFNPVTGNEVPFGGGSALVPEVVAGSATLLPTSGVADKIYVTSSDNIAYRSLGGSAYQRISGRNGAKTLPYSASADITQRLIDANTQSPGAMIELPVGSSAVSGQITTAASTRLHIVGTCQNSGSSLSQVNSSFAGAAFSPNGNYTFRDFRLIGPGPGVAGSVGIGTNAAISISGEMRNLFFDGFESCVDFGSSVEHPAQLLVDHIYMQNFGTVGMNFGGNSAATSGESSWVFGRIFATNLPVMPTAIIPTKTAFNTTTDRLTWTGVVPRFGWLVIRSPQGAGGVGTDTGNWKIISNQNDWIIATTVDVPIVAGELWTYLVINNTVGLALWRAKAVSIANLQCEDVGIGTYLDNITGCTIGTTYSETHPGVNKMGMLAGIYSRGSLVSLGTGWCEGAATSIINNTGRLKFDILRANNLTHGMVGQVSNNAAVGAPVIGGIMLPEGTTPAKIFQMGNAGSEWTIAKTDFNPAITGMEMQIDGANGGAISVRKQGLEVIRLDSSTVNGFSRLTGVQLARIDVPSKDLLPLLAAISQVTILTNGVATPVLKFTMGADASVGLAVPFTIKGSDTVSRQALTGILTIAAVTSYAPAVVSVTISGQATGLNAGTLTIAPVTGTSIANGGGYDVTISVTATSSLTGGLLFSCNAISLTGNDATAITQL